MSFEYFKRIHNVDVFNEIIKYVRPEFWEYLYNRIIKGNPEEMEKGYKIAYDILKRLEVI